jgi:H+/Cl- antiporter ClcA
MRPVFDLAAYRRALWHLFFWTVLTAPVGVLSGSASALFLWALDRVTLFRFTHRWLLLLLPVAGAVVVWVYDRVGKGSDRGNNLILDRIHEPGGGVPARMAPLVLVGTLLTHLFGGSAGREGTALQMGGSLASAYARLCRIPAEHLRVLLMAGVAAGFGSVFGTPVTGAVFAMEVLVVGRMQYDAVIPVLVASIVADATCSAWGIHHSVYRIAIEEPASVHAFLAPALLGKVVIAAILFGLAAMGFAELSHGLQHAFRKYLPWAALRPVVGASIIIALTLLLGTDDYLGLGVIGRTSNSVTLLSAFHEGGSAPWSWWWKLLFTAVTLSCGFKGGEVTPLFFIGATLGNTLAVLTGAPVDLFAGLGFIAVFAGATNTPLACTLMGIELFGGHYAVYFAIACFVAYYCSGRRGIYTAQRFTEAKAAATP